MIPLVQASSFPYRLAYQIPSTARGYALPMYPVYPIYQPIYRQPYIWPRPLPSVNSFPIKPYHFSIPINNSKPVSVDSVQIGKQSNKNKEEVIFHPKTGYTNWIISGLLAVGAAIAGVIVHTRVNQVPIQETPAEVLKPLLKLEDFKIPPGLETPEKRRAKTVELVNAVFPTLLELYNDKRIDPAWGAKINLKFNAELQKRVHPNIQVLLDIGFGIRDPDGRGGEYVPDFVSERVKNCIGGFRSSSVIASIVLHDTSSDEKKYKNLLSKKKLEKPIYFLGTIEAMPIPDVKTDEGKARLYSILLHEVNHLLYSIAIGPQELQDARDRGSYRFMPPADTIFNIVMKKKNIPIQFIKSVPEQTSPLPKIWAELDKIEREQEFGYGFLKYLEKNELFECVDKYYNEHTEGRTQENLKKVFLYNFQLEREGYTTFSERFKLENRTFINIKDPSQLYHADVRDRIISLISKDIIKYCSQRFDFLTLREQGFFNQ